MCFNLISKVIRQNKQNIVPSFIRRLYVINVVSNVVTITSAVRSGVIIFEINFLFS